MPPTAGDFGPVSLRTGGMGGFLSQVSRCVKDGETAWLLCLEDFEEADGGGFRWNEFEQLSLQAAADAGDTVWQADIRRFWDAHIPVGLSVGGAYEYYAIDRKSVV